MTRRKATDSGQTIRLSKARLAEMIETATVDCTNESEEITGWFTMIEEKLVVPFEAVVLGVDVTVSAWN